MFANRAELLDGKGVTLLGVALFTLLSAMIVTPALPGILAQFHGVANAALLTKLVLTTPPLFVALSGPVLGMLLPRVGSKQMLFWSVLGAGIIGSAGGTLATLPQLLICRAILGVTIAGMMVASTALIGDLYRGKQRTTFLGWQAAAMKFGGVVFFVVGGLLAAISWRAAFAGHLLTLLVLPGVILALPAHVRQTETATHSPLSGAELRFTGLVCLVAYIGQVIFFAIPTQVPFLMTERLNSSPQVIGLVISGNTMFGMITATTYHWFKERLGYVPIATIAFAVTAVAFAGLAVATSVGAVYAALAAVGLAFGLLIPNLSAWVLAGTRREHRGTAVGALTMALFLGQFSSPLLAQPFVRKGIGDALGVAAIVCVVVAVVLTMLTLTRVQAAREPIVEATT